MLVSKAIIITSLTAFVCATSYAIVANQCDVPIYLWSVDGSVSTQIILLKDSFYSEKFPSDSLSSGTSLKITSNPNGIFTQNSSQLTFA
jgi:hypothetical protein